MKILSLSRFIPEHICDSLRFTKYPGDRNISHYCGYVSDFISQVLADDTIDGAVYPKSCDSTRTITSYLQDTGKYLHQISIPSVGVPGAEEFFASEIRRYRESLERHYNVFIDDIELRIDRINIRNDAIREAYDRLECLSYSEYLLSVHKLLNKPLFDQNWKKAVLQKKSTEKRVFVIGSSLSNINIAEAIEQVGLTVVGDTLPESGRLVSMPSVDGSGDIYKGIAHSILSAGLSPTQNGFDLILKRNLEEIRKKEVRGVIFVIQKYCEPYEFLFCALKAMLEEKGIKILKLLLNDTDDERKVHLALEAFVDTM